MNAECRFYNLGDENEEFNQKGRSLQEQRVMDKQPLTQDFLCGYVEMAPTD